jgi:mannosyltransferase
MGGQAKSAATNKQSAQANADRTAASRSALELEPNTVFALTIAMAAALYFYRLGAASLGAAEAYSAWAAAMPSPLAIIHIPVPLDPGKQVFYYILLHYFTGVFGMSETSLRLLSAISALVTLAVLFVLARSMFNDTIAASACVLWALNPAIMLLSRRARMYPMFAAIALTHFMLLWQVRRRPTWLKTSACGFLGALTLYTHLAGLLLLGTEAAMLVRDCLRGRRDAPPWIALAIALALFLPYIPIFSLQSQALLSGHWLDWMDAGYRFNLVEKVVATVLAIAAAAAIIFGPNNEGNNDEPIRWCLAWGALPLVALLAGSVIVRPMFQIRYLIPCVAMIALILARAIERLGSKRRNLVVAGITLVFLFLVPIKEISFEPWRDVASLISAQSRPNQPVFFESGFLFFDRPNGVANPGFPSGYYRNVFDYYSHTANPRVAVPGWDSAAARNLIADRVNAADGGWLVSWKYAPDARAELPDPALFRIKQVADYNLVAVYQIQPIAPSSH